jgi:uncharacterized protein (TIGR02996 family)
VASDPTGDDRRGQALHRFLAVWPEVQVTPETTFLQAITAQPGDDALRLVFADWLDERGTPEAVTRAALLRLEVQARREPPRKRRLKQQLRRFREEHPGAAAWLDWCCGGNVRAMLSSIPDRYARQLIRFAVRCVRETPLGGKLRLPDFMNDPRSQTALRIAWRFACGHEVAQAKLNSAAVAAHEADDCCPNQDVRVPLARCAAALVIRAAAESGAEAPDLGWPLLCAEMVTGQVCKAAEVSETLTGEGGIKDAAVRFHCQLLHETVPWSFTPDVGK